MCKRIIKNKNGTRAVRYILYGTVPDLLIVVILEFVGRGRGKVYSDSLRVFFVNRVGNLSPAMGRGIDSRNRVWN